MRSVYYLFVFLDIKQKLPLQYVCLGVRMRVYISNLQRLLQQVQVSTLNNFFVQ